MRLEAARIRGLAALGLILGWAPPAAAIRPFVTDDARVVGEGYAQLETWCVLDRFVFEHNAFAAIGPTPWLELTLGVTQGGVHSGTNTGYSLVGPVVQGKALLISAADGGRPGLAIAAGIIPPWGVGAFPAPGVSGFTYVALTESLFEEDLLIHANVGFAVGDAGVTSLGVGGSNGSRAQTLVTAGLGAQVRVVAGLHGVAEIYYGDPYDPRTNFPAMQLGSRYIFSDSVQMDATFGSTLTEVTDGVGHSQTEQWGSLGIRLVTPRTLW